jgi:hypothetical protein
MKSFNDISINILLAIFLIFLLEVIYIYYHHKNKENTDVMEKYDLNHDGVITKEEVIKVIHGELERKNKEPIQIEGLIRCSTSGALRGFVTGLLIGGVEGAVTGSIVMAIINPLIAGIEHKL